MLIRTLDPATDLNRVHHFYRDAPDYWELAEGRTPDRAKAQEFFTDGPPGCDPALSHRLGLFLDDRLSGLAELSFGFPEPGDAYLGFMMLGQWARNQGYGPILLAEVEQRAQGASALYLAVMESNPQAFAFWRREGFVETGLTGEMMVGDKDQTLHRLAKLLQID